MGKNYNHHKILNDYIFFFSGNFHFMLNFYTESEMFLIAVAESDIHISVVHVAVWHFIVSLLPLP